LRAVERAKHALPGSVQKETHWWLYAYYVDCDQTGGYVTATDGHRASKWRFHATEAPEFCGPVSVADVDVHRKARDGVVFLTLAENISYPDVWQAARKAMQGSMLLGRVSRVKALLRAVSAFERAGFESVVVDFQGTDVHIAAEDMEVGLRSSAPKAIVGEAKATCCVNPEYLAAALRAIERGKLNNDNVVAELSPKALRFILIDGADITAEEVIMTRRLNES
jgi:hypothetical protein